MVGAVKNKAGENSWGQEGRGRTGVYSSEVREEAGRKGWKEEGET